MQGPRSLSYNPAENAVLITSDVDGGSYELYVVPKDASGRSDTPVSSGPCSCCVTTAMFRAPGNICTHMLVPRKLKPACDNVGQWCVVPSQTAILAARVFEPA